MPRIWFLMLDHIRFNCIALVSPSYIYFLPCSLGTIIVLSPFFLMVLFGDDRKSTSSDCFSDII
jgi:hypothetical protein